MNPLAAGSIFDLRLTVRKLAKQPLFTVVAVLVLALGIGTATAIFTLLDAVVLSPLPFPESNRLVALGHSSPNVGMGDVGQCAAWHITYEEENRVFEDLGMYTPGQTAAVTGGGEPEAVWILRATSGIFHTLGMKPVLGRNLTPADEDPDAPAVILLGYGYWRSRYGGSPEVIGKRLQIDGRESEIIGVLPASLLTLGQDPAIVGPLRFRRAELFVGNVGYQAVARLREGVTLEEAEADMERMLPLAYRKFPGGPGDEFNRGAKYIPHVRHLKDDLVGDAKNTLWILMAGVAVVLLIACTNVANLLLVRAEARGREMAVRSAMGASRARIRFEYVRESILLGLLGGLGGLGLAHVCLRVLVAVAPARLPRLSEVSLNPESWLAALALSLAAGAFLGGFPALKWTGRNLADSLKQGSHGVGIGGERHRAQNALVITQVTLALVLLVAAGLVFRSALALRYVNPGFSHASDVLAFRLSIPPRLVRDPEERALLQESVARRLQEVPGVTSVGMATDLPMHAGGNINPLFVEGVTAPGRTPAVTRRHKWIGEGYFETLGIRVLAGRTFTWHDVHNRIPGVVVSESLARAYWGSVAAALGKRVSVRPDPIRWHEVIGVAADVREDGINLDPVPMVYWPQVALAFWQGSPADEVLVWRSASYAVRSNRVGTPDFLEDVRNAVWSVNPNLPLFSAGPLSGFAARSTAETTFVLILMSVAAAISLVLVLVGVYGVVSYSVTRRMPELAMRMALGAEAARVRRMVLGQTLVLAGAGIAIGIILALTTVDLISDVLFGVSPTDPVTFAAVAALLAAAALAAGYLPARRASRVDPMVVLRTE